MPVWPFGKKGKAARDASVTTEKAPLAGPRKDTPPRTPRKLSRSESNRRRRASTRSSKRAKAPLDDHDPMPPNAKLTAEQRMVNDTPAADTSAGEEEPKREIPSDANGENQQMSSHYYRQGMSNTSVQTDRPVGWTRPPTLRAKRSANNDPGLLRRKSSKKRKSDHVREEEIKSMSPLLPLQKRPATHGGGPLRRDSRKMHGGLNKHLERPTSDISLPIPESLHSSFSSSSDRRGFKVRSLDVFSPRPTIRYSQGRYPVPALPPSRSNSKREQRDVIPEESTKPSKTIDELADELDAGGLRELMERDERRQERKRKSDTDQAKRRLQRKADHQAEQDPKEKKRRDVDRGVLGREALPAEEPFKPTVTTNDQTDASAENANTSPVSWLHDPSREALNFDPFSDREAKAVDPTPEAPPVSTEVPPQPRTSPPRSPKYNIFAPPNSPPPTDLNRQSVTTIPENENDDRRTSTASDQAFGTGWTSFFRRSLQKPKRNSTDRGRHTPSEFSNTSRDSLQQRQPRATPKERAARRTSGTPVRTMSKFREDLPELPISPPNSRIQSPEAALPEAMHENAIPERAESSLAERISMAASSVDARDPFADPALKGKGDRSARGSRSMEVPSPEGGAPSTIVSQSLASIDSEGSWLSGRPAKRNSQPLSPPLRESESSLQKRYNDFSDSAEELGVAEDEYFSRLTPGPEQSYGGNGGGPVQDPLEKRRPSSTAMFSETTDESPTLATTTTTTVHHGTVARQPTIVHHGTRAKSSEGLLNQFQEGESVDPDSPASPTNRSFDLPGEEEEIMGKPQRATSVDLGMKHVRHISAGSAKLLDIHPRTSVDGKRLSGASGSQPL
ncbi:MAG: hypothetical protein M4579_004950 [Chaenotheca gracillima]|nr:MAG: hypothetical protein M4579_004950 [Chaenotheca gracillima]